MYTFKDIWLLSEANGMPNTPSDNSSNNKNSKSSGMPSNISETASNNQTSQNTENTFMEFFGQYINAFNEHFEPKYEYRVDGDVLEKILKVLSLSGNKSTESARNYKAYGLDQYFPFVDFVLYITALQPKTKVVDKPIPDRFCANLKVNRIFYEKEAEKYIKVVLPQKIKRTQSLNPLDYEGTYIRTSNLADQLKKMSDGDRQEIGKAFLEKEDVKKMSIQKCLYALGNQSFKLKKITNKPDDEREGGLDKVILDPDKYAASQKSIPMLFGSQYPDFSAKDIATLGIYIRKLFEHQRDQIIDDYSNQESEPIDPDKPPQHLQLRYPEQQAQLTDRKRQLALPDRSQLSDSLIDLYLTSLLTEDARGRAQLALPYKTNDPDVIDAEFEVIDDDNKTNTEQAKTNTGKTDTEQVTANTGGKVIVSRANVKDLYTNRSITEVEVDGKKIKVFNWKLVEKSTNKEIKQKASSNTVGGGYTIENLKILKDSKNKYAGLIYDMLLDLADTVDDKKLERIQQGMSATKDIFKSLASIGGPNMGR